MRTGTHARDDGSFGRSASSQTLKGAALIALAVIIGVVLLHTAPRSTTAVSTTPPHTATTKPGRAGSGSTGGAASTSTTLAPAHQAGQVVVLVANGAGVSGLGGRVRGQLNTAGYNTSKPAINASSSNVASTAIYFQPGYEADALNVANTLSLAAGNVFAMPTPPPVPANDLTGVNVVVVAGSDVAGGSSSSTTEAPAGNTIAPSPTVASNSGGSGSSGTTTTTVHHTTTTVAHSTTTVAHSTTTVAAAHSTTTAARTTTTVK